jgi:nucleolar MIF4G domain-containing protein 1
LNFTYLQAKTRTFLEVLLTTIILRSQKRSPDDFNEKSLLGVFGKVAEAPQMARGLQYFVKKVVSRAEITINKSERETVQFGCRVLDDFLAGMEISLSNEA